MVPLAVILRRQMSWERIEKLDVLYGSASESNKGEDFTLVKAECQRVPGHGDTTFSDPALFDGHNGFEQLLYTPRRISSIYSKQLLCIDLLELTYGTTD